MAVKGVTREVARETKTVRTKTIKILTTSVELMTVIRRIKTPIIIAIIMEIHKPSNRRLPEDFFLVTTTINSKTNRTLNEITDRAIKIITNKEAANERTATTVAETNNNKAQMLIRIRMQINNKSRRLKLMAKE